MAISLRKKLKNHSKGVEYVSKPIVSKYNDEANPTPTGPSGDETHNTRQPNVEHSKRAKRSRTGDLSSNPIPRMTLEDYFKFLVQIKSKLEKNEEITENERAIVLDKVRLITNAEKKLRSPKKMSMLAGEKVDAARNLYNEIYEKLNVNSHSL